MRRVGDAPYDYIEVRRVRYERTAKSNPPAYSFGMMGSNT
jgi:hypothetical protein